MAQTLVVTFDLSEFGEHVLDVAVPEAQATSAQVHLLHVLRPARETTTAGHNFDPVSETQAAAYAGRQPETRVREIETATQAAERQQYEALTYLNGLAARFPAGTAKGVVRSGTHPAREIIRYAQDVGADKIVMATHGRTALAHVVLGSVAAAVVRTSPVPVLLKRPSAMPPHPEDVEA
jgi:nucleotide-binding universal stress UspA family protein